MRKAVRLVIPEPCSENWDKMSPEGKGRFCGKCEKTVVDFTGMPSLSILDFLNQSSGEVCGRIRPSQMTITSVVPAVFHQPEFSLRAVVLGLALTTFCALNASAQQEAVQGGISVEQVESRSKSLSGDSLEYTVFAKDEAGKAIPLATVMISYSDGSFQTFQTNEAGSCRFRTVKQIAGIRANLGSDLRSDYYPVTIFNQGHVATVVLRDFDPPIMGKIAPPRNPQK